MLCTGPEAVFPPRAALRKPWHSGGHAGLCMYAVITVRLTVTVKFPANFNFRPYIKQMER